MLNQFNLKKALFSNQNLIPQSILGGVGKTLYYNQPFLNGTSSNSETFLKEISYQVNLTGMIYFIKFISSYISIDLYQVVGSCYINSQMEYCPVLLQIKHHILRRDYELQDMVRINSLAQLKVWAISNEYFIYKPQEGDEDSDCFHITNLRKDNCTMLIPDTISDPSCNIDANFIINVGVHLAYNDGILFIANQHKIYLIECKDRLGKGEKVRFQQEQAKIQSINPGLPIHAMFIFRKQINMYFAKTLLVVALETHDNQIDFSHLEIQNLGRESFSYNLKQQREVVNRDVRIDRVVKFSYIIDSKNIMYGIALRDSGKFDLYWDMILVDSPENVTIFDINVSFDTLYFWTPSGQIKHLSTIGQSQISYQQAQDVFPDFDFNIIFYQNIKRNFNLYNSFTLIRTTLYVVHGSYISLYHIQDQVWIKHIIFEEGDIHRMFKKWTKRDGSQTEKLEIAVLLKNGSIYNNILNLVDSLNNNKDVIATGNRTFQIPGKVIKSCYDNQDYYWFYAMVKDLDDKIRVFVLHYDQLYELNEGLEQPFDEYTNIVALFDPQSDCNILIQKHGHVTIYEQKIGKPDIVDDGESQNLLQPLQDTVLLRPIMSIQIGQIQGNVHSCISKDLHDHILLIDEFNFYMYMISKKTTAVYKNHNCVGAYAVDHKFIYTLSHAAAIRSSGLRLYDINNILTKSNDISYGLQDVQVGFQGHIDWNNEYSRLSFQKSFDSLTIVPALHRNTIAFIGMAARKDYLATKVIKDKFIALDFKNYLYCWSVVTGKLLAVNRLPNQQDYSSFQIYQSPKDVSEDSEYKREWYHKILLMKKTPETMFDMQTMDLVTGSQSTKQQQTFLHQQKKELREFRLIEIMNEDEVKEHINFIHPIYPNEHQRIFFNENSHYMLEKFTHPRVFIYERIEIEGRGQVHWRLVRRLNKFPADLEADSGPLKIMSPCFQYYIDINRGTNQFFIKDTFTQQEVYTISKEFMNPSKEKPHQLMFRFKWVDSDTIKLINKEGIEKKIDLKDNFKEIEFNIVPLFDTKSVKDPTLNFYTNRPALEISEVLHRLKRKYQRYKSAYYLDHKREPFSLYQELFTVDYQVEKCAGMYVSDMSFTFLHWKIMEQLAAKNINISSIDDSVIEILVYNILPGGDTLLHKLCQNGEVIKKIFVLAHPNEEKISETKFHIPFLQNLKHQSPLHVCMDTQDLRTMDTFIKYLAAYGLDHHSRAITDLIPFMIQKQLPSLLNYLDSRLQQTKQLKKIKKGCLKKKSLGITEAPCWFNNEEFTNKLMAQTKEDDETLIERPIKVEFIDIPRIYDYSEEISQDFFICLAETDQYEIFERKVIQKMIEFNYPIVMYWTLKKLFIPFNMFQATLFIYLNVIFQQENFLLQQLDFPMQVALGIFSGYFLRNEMQQLQKDGWAWFGSVWNYVDVITPCTISSVLIINAFSLPIAPETERTIQAIGVFFMWFKLLQFFRIFKSYGYLTRLLMMVISDMSTFLVVLFITIVAFSDTFLTLSNGNPEHEKFVYSFTDSIIYVYRIVLGDFDVSKFGQVAVPLCYGLFILCTIFNTIVMLNLLIAIISETFSHVKENAVNASYQEMAAMIAENSYIIPQEVKETYAESNRFICCVTDLEAEYEKEDDETIKRIEQLKKNVISKMDHIGKELKEYKSNQHKQQESLEKQEKQNNKILIMLQLMQNMNGGAPLNLSQNNNDNQLNSSLMAGLRASIRKTNASKADFESSRGDGAESQR